MGLYHHRHPYEIFIPPGALKLIVGTLPPPRFSEGRLKPGDVDFCYGSCDGTLWPVLSEIFQLKLRYDNSPAAVQQRLDFLVREKIGICDIVQSCRRSKIDASDLGMMDIEVRNIVEQLQLHPSITTLIFTGGNSKNGPEYLFRRHLRAFGLKLSRLKVSPGGRDTPKFHQFILDNRIHTTISLTSPSNAANRAIGSSALYKKRKKENPAYTPYDFRIEQYRKIFTTPAEFLPPR